MHPRFDRRGDRTSNQTPAPRPHRPEFPGPAAARNLGKIEVFIYLNGMGVPMRRTAGALERTVSGAQPLRWPQEAAPRIGEYLAAKDGFYLIKELAHDLPPVGENRPHRIHIWVEKLPEPGKER